MEATEALSALGGVSGHAALIALSTRRKLRTAVARGDIVRVSHDRYALTTTDRARRLAIELDGHLSHLSAVLHYGWEVCGAPAEPHLIVPPSRADAVVDRARLHVHAARPHELRGWATAPITTVLMCARDLEARSALAVADSALRHGDVAHDELGHAAEVWPRHVRMLVAAAHGAAANPFESALRQLTRECGLELVPQLEVRAGGWVFHPDLVDPIGGVVIEADSWSYHADKEAHERDCRRYTLLTADGWLVLRFTYDDVMHRPDYVRRCLRALLGLRPSISRHAA